MKGKIINFFNNIKKKFGKDTISNVEGLTKLEDIPEILTPLDELPEFDMEQDYIKPNGNLATIGDVLNEKDLEILLSVLEDVDDEVPKVIDEESKEGIIQEDDVADSIKEILDNCDIDGLESDDVRKMYDKKLKEMSEEYEFELLLFEESKDKEIEKLKDEYDLKLLALNEEKENLEKSSNLKDKEALIESKLSDLEIFEKQKIEKLNELEASKIQEMKLFELSKANELVELEESMMEVISNLEAGLHEERKAFEEWKQKEIEEINRLKSESNLKNTSNLDSITVYEELLEEDSIKLENDMNSDIDYLIEAIYSELIASEEEEEEEEEEGIEEVYKRLFDELNIVEESQQIIEVEVVETDDEVGEGEYSKESFESLKNNQLLEIQKMKAELLEELKGSQEESIKLEATTKIEEDVNKESKKKKTREGKKFFKSINRFFAESKMIPIVSVLIIVMFVISLGTTKKHYTNPKDYLSQSLHSNHSASAISSKTLMFFKVDRDPQKIFGSLEDMVLNISSEKNMKLNEHYIKYNLSNKNDTFEWERFYKNKSAIMKTPFEPQYITIDNFEDLGFAFDKNSGEKIYTDSITSFVSTLKRREFKTISRQDKSPLNYGFLSYLTGMVTPMKDYKTIYSINSTNGGQKLFNDIFIKTLNDTNFKSFLKEEADIQNKLDLEDNLPEVNAIIENLMKGSTVENVEAYFEVNKDRTVSIIDLIFTISYDIVEGQEPALIKLHINTLSSLFDESQEVEREIFRINNTPYNMLYPRVERDEYKEIISTPVIENSGTLEDMDKMLKLIEEQAMENLEEELLEEDSEGN